MSWRPTRREFLKTSLGVVGAAALAACTPPAPAPAVPAPAAEQMPDETNKGLEQIGRISESLLELRGWAPAMYNPVADVKSFNDQLFFKKMEELTNVRIKWEHASPDPGVDALSLLMASGDLPDFICGISAIDCARYGLRGALEPLNDWINCCAPNYSRLLQKQPEILGSLTAPDGKAYGFPRAWEDRIVATFAGFIIRKDWLDELGLPIPETTDQYYETLKAFKEKDPARYPFTWDPTPLIWQWGVGSHGPNNPLDFYRDGSAVKYGPLEAGYQEALAYINKLYTEGLLDPEYQETMNTPDFLQARMTTGISGAMLGYAGTHLTAYIKTLGPGKITAMKPPKGPQGDQYVLSNHGVIDASQCGAIAKSSQHKEELVKYIDYYYSDSGVLLMNWGLYGETYTIENGEKKYTAKVTQHESLSTSEYMWNYVSPVWIGPMLVDVASSKATRAPEAWEGIQIWATVSDKIKLPIVYFTQEEQNIVTERMTDINTLVAETMSGFIDGSKTLDADYKAFVDTLRGLGIQEVIDTYQKAYDRFLAATT